MKAMSRAHALVLLTLSMWTLGKAPPRDVNPSLTAGRELTQRILLHGRSSYARPPSSQLADGVSYCQNACIAAHAGCMK